ncbi:MAG: DUF99 family protein [Nanoarchaeota archaeon]
MSTTKEYQEQYFLKKQIRVLGIDDAPFDFKDETCLVIAAFFRGGEWMDGVLSTRVEVDGEDATIKLIDLVNKSKFKAQTRAIFLDGIALGGFNVVNINSLHKHTGIPVLAIVRKRPDFITLEKTLKRLGMDRKYQLMEKAGQPKEVKLKQGKLFIQTAGIGFEKAEKILRLCCTRSYLPEAIRAAHLIGAGVIKGESKGKA